MYHKEERFLSFSLPWGLVKMNANNHVRLSQAVTLNSALSETASVKPTFKLLPACAAQKNRAFHITD